MSKKDKIIAKAEADAKRQKKKSCIPPDNYGERYVTGLEKQVTQGKGMRIRDISGWHSDATTEKLNKIFDKRQKEYNKNTDSTDTPEFDKPGKKDG